MAVPVIHVCDKFGVAGSSIHGVSRLFSWWFPRFDAARFDVSLVGLKAPEPASELLAAEGVPVTHLNRGKFDPRILTDLIALGRDRKARVLHVHGYAAADFGRIAARQIGAALVLHEHFADPSMPPYQALADRFLAPLTDAAIAVSGSTRDFLIGDRFVPRERVRLIWNGAPLDEFAPAGPDEAAALRREFDISPDALLIGAIGRLNAQKGHRYLLDAAAIVLKKRPDVKFFVAGDGDLLEPLRQQARKLGIADQVVMAGHRRDVPRILAAIDVFAIASLYEGTPLTLFEAMAAGKSIVSTAVDGCAEILKDGETGLLVPPCDPSALAEALLVVVEDETKRKELAQTALADSRHYDTNECVRKIEALYDELLVDR